MPDFRAIQLAEARRQMEHRKPAPDIRTERLLEALAMGGGSVAAGMAPGGGIADAAGYLPGMDGERLPSLYENLKSGNYIDAGLQGLGAVGDMMYAAGPVGVAVGTVAKGPRAASKAKKVTKSVATVFDDVMDPAVALARAKKGAHLKTNKAGKYVGAPLEMNMPQKLGKMRREADRLVDVGAPHRMWYDKEREVISDLTDDPVLQKNLARTGALYSSQAKPITESSFAFKAHNNAVLGGDPSMRVRTQEQASNFANAYRDYPSSGMLHPEDIELGPKTNPYSEGKDPTIDMNSLWKTANDIRQGRVYGYGDDFSRGFTAAEHGFLTGENLLLADRANARNPQPQPWNVLRAQASTWVSLDAEKRIAAAVEKAAKAGKRLTSSDLARITADAFDEASAGLPKGLDRNSVVMTNEARPGAGVGHLTMGDDEQDLIQRYTDIVLGQTDQRDPVLTSLDMYATRARPAQGTYMNEAGAIERNPGWTHRVGVGTEVTDAGGTRSFPYTSERDEAAINFATDIGAYNRAQEAGANSRFMPEGMGKQNVADMSAVRADLSGAEPQTVDELIRAGISPIDFGGGDTMLMKLGEAQGGRAGPLPAGNFGPLEGSTGDILAALPSGTQSQRGSVRSNYRPTGLTSPAGSGQATELLLQRADEASQKVPGIEQRTAPAVANQARLMNEIDDAFARETGKAQREDLRKARAILAEGGVPALRRYVEKYGSAGLPAVVLGMLGLQAAQQPREGGA